MGGIRFTNQVVVIEVILSLVTFSAEICYRSFRSPPFIVFSLERPRWFESTYFRLVGLYNGPVTLVHKFYNHYMF
jgi:hypothetical protein